MEFTPWSPLAWRIGGKPERGELPALHVEDHFDTPGLYPLELDPGRSFSHLDRITTGNAMSEWRMQGAVLELGPCLVIKRALDVHDIERISRRGEYVAMPLEGCEFIVQLRSTLGVDEERHGLADPAVRAKWLEQGYHVYERRRDTAMSEHQWCGVAVAPEFTTRNLSFPSGDVRSLSELTETTLQLSLVAGVTHLYAHPTFAGRSSPESHLGIQVATRGLDYAHAHAALVDRAKQLRKDFEKEWGRWMATLEQGAQ